MASPGIYISIPFCAQKCTYCNFRSDVYARTLRSDYIRLLVQEVCSSEVRDGNSLYFGGGSPSLLDPEEFDEIAAALPRAAWEEATIEVAPGEATPERISSWVAAGTNRASLGVQSFDATVARAAGRKHDAETVRTEIDRLSKSGVRSVSVDLIAGLAHQTASTWQRSLEWVDRLAVDHVSVYMLESDDASRLGRELQAGGNRYGAKQVPSENEIVDFYVLAVEQLQSMGYERYEVSNFARPGRRSIHNLKYWRMEPYFGFGSDAHSFWGHWRWSNVGSAPEYVRRMAEGQSPRGDIEDLGPKRMLEDRVLTGMRTSEGIRLEQRDWLGLLPRAETLAARGWLEIDEPSLRLTHQGILFADQAIAELLG